MEYVKQAVDVIEDNSKSRLAQVSMLSFTERYLESLEIAEQLCQENPSDIKSLEFKIQSLAELCMRCAVEEQIPKLLEIAPHSSVAYLYLGICAFGKHKFNDAIKFFKKYIKLSNDLSTVSLGWLARTYILMGEFKKARKVIKKYLEIDPDNKWIREHAQKLDGEIDSGIELFEAGQHYEAFEWLKLESKKEQQPGRANFYLKLVEAEESENIESIDEVVNEFKKYLPLDFVLCEAACIKIDLGYRKEGLADLKKAYALNPSGKNGYYLAYCLNQDGLKDEAVKLCNQLLSRNPQLSRIHYLLGLCTEEPSEALKLFNQALELKPENVAFGAKVAECLYKSGGYTEAIERYWDLIKSGEEPYPDIWVEIGRCYLAVGNKRFAHLCAKEALWRDETHEDAEELLQESNL